MNILIIGSKGFIGSHAVSYFSKLTHKVYGCDVMVDYNNENYFVIDATNADYYNIFQKNKFDVCINCSGAASVPDSLKNPLRDYTLNTVNVFKILDAIRQFQPDCKFINLSSAAVYGNPKQLPIKETDELNPVSPYGIHKMQAEEICKEFHLLFGLKTCSLRIFSAYGEGLKKQLFWDLYQKTKNTDSIELFGTGQETRDFIYISDLLFAIECVIRNAPFQNDKINIANGEEITIEEVANTFASFFATTKQITFNNKIKQGDPLNWKADITTLLNLGYIKKINIQKGLKAYKKWAAEC
jgi:dTDP-glucose 4,6-dehydratase/UDP-glucose 4-epimerase